MLLHYRITNISVSFCDINSKIGITTAWKVNKYRETLTCQMNVLYYIYLIELQTEKNNS